MINSMTGFGSGSREAKGIGKISAELRSSNHKFLEIVLHLPEGFLALEDKIKKEIEARVKRGRVTCSVNISGSKALGIFINRPLLKNYILVLRKIKEQFALRDELSINTLMHLPGVLSTQEGRIMEKGTWEYLSQALEDALAKLSKSRQKEGRSLARFLKNRARGLKNNLGVIKARFKKAVRDKAAGMKNDEERSAFLKDSDITEEIERLSFHINNFIHKTAKSGPVGKELDFIAQEMQREANTMGAKSFDAAISGKVIWAKSQIEKIREQVQNIE